MADDQELLRGARAAIGGDPYTDPQAENVTDGSVDYYDFDWGDPVFYAESEMERCVINCDQSCPDSSTGCGNNLPEQTDETDYEIREEA